MHYNTKTIARLAAVQAIYSLNNDDITPEHAIELILEYYKSDQMHEDYELPEYAKVKPHRGHLTALVNYTQECLAELDIMVQEHLVAANHPQELSSLNITMLSIIRVGICELKYFPECSHKIVINEYTNIASMLLKDQDVAFVNSCLDFVYKAKFAEGAVETVETNTEQNISPKPSDVDSTS